MFLSKMNLDEVMGELNDSFNWNDNDWKWESSTFPWVKDYAKVNVEETDTYYKIQVEAPGLDKENFKIKINPENNTMKINYLQADISAKKTKYLRREFKKYTKFSRLFSFNEIVDPNNVKAKYIDGILYISLLKKEKEENKESVQINVE